MQQQGWAGCGSHRPLSDVHAGQGDVLVGEWSYRKILAF